MPNHVFNSVTVSGSPEAVEMFDQAVRAGDKPFDFQRIIPLPAIVVELTPDTPLISTDVLRNYPGMQILNWRIEWWGTKWNAYEFGECGPGQYSFWTAWSPPLPVIEVLSKLFPQLTISIEFQDEFEEESESVTFGLDSSEGNAS